MEYVITNQGGQYDTQKQYFCSMQNVKIKFISVTDKTIQKKESWSFKEDNKPKMSLLKKKIEMKE